MEAKKPKVGAKLVVSTTDGDEDDEVTRVVSEDVAAGLWVVETLRNGRVIVLKGQSMGQSIAIRP